MIKDKNSIICTCSFVLSRIINKVPGLVVLHVFVMLISSLFFAAKTIFLQFFFENVSLIVTNTSNFFLLLTLVLVLLFIQILCEVFNGWSVYLLNSIKGKTEKFICEELHLKISKLPPIVFEHAETLDKLSSAQLGAQRASIVYDSIISICLFYIPYFVVISWYLYLFRPALVLVIVSLAIPLFSTQIIRKKKQKEFVDISAPMNRECDYYRRELTDPQYTVETRQLGTFKFFYEKYKVSLEQYSNARWSSVKKTLFGETVLRLLSLSGYIMAIIILVNSLLNGYISIAVFASVFYAVNTMVGFIEDGLLGSLRNLTDVNALIVTLAECLELDEKNKKEEQVNLDKHLVVQNVSFSYPNTNIPAVNNVSFTINPGETVAIVGENGSGKTTLVRLILGELLPDSGDIFYDNSSVLSVSPNCFHKIASSVNQNYIRYKFTLEDNIAISDPATTIDAIAIKDCLTAVEFDHPDNIELSTYLSREFGGVELSGGQWQRIAVARGLYKKHTIIALDEPTAAIDPLEEVNVYKQFYLISKDKTALLVTHRMGAARIADRILVLEKGEIMEEGNHESLMKKNGLYASMYNMQAHWYS